MAEQRMHTLPSGQQVQVDEHGLVINLGIPPWRSDHKTPLEDPVVDYAQEHACATGANY